MSPAECGQTARSRHRATLIGTAAVMLALALPAGMLASDGDELDKSFSRDGIRYVDGGRWEDGHAVFVDANGSVFVAGESYADPGRGAHGREARVALARLTPEGKLDRDFGGDGRVEVDPTPDSDRAWSWARGTDGSFAVLSTIERRQSVIGYSLTRLLASGKRDRSFGSDGVVRLAARAQDFETDLVILPDGAVVTMVSGQSTRLRRNRPDGSLDRRFGQAGEVRLGGLRRAALIAQPGGHLVIAGARNRDRGASPDLVVLDAFRSDGQPARRFGDRGRARLAIGGPGDKVSAGINDATLGPDGSLIVAGGGTDVLVARFTAEGRVDRSFSHNGWRTIDFGPIDRLNGVTAAPDGRIFVAGVTFNSIFGHEPSLLIVSALNADGSLVQSFANGGTLKTDFGCDDEYYGLDVQFDRGTLLVAGGNRTFPCTTSDMFVARLSLDGSGAETLTGQGARSPCNPRFQ